MRGDLDGGVARLCQAGCGGGPATPQGKPVGKAGFPACPQSPPHTAKPAVKGSGGPAFLGEQSGAAGVVPLASLPAISCRPETKPYSGIYATLEIAIGGTLTRLRCIGSRARRSIAYPAKRGVIRDFSLKSRARLQDIFSSIDMRKIPRRPRFITLTYPATWDPDPRTWKRHLEAFLKRLERKYGVFAVAKRLEFQERGAPHFHLICFTRLFLRHDWVAKAWNAIVAPGNEAALKAGTRTEGIRSRRGIHAYVNKYMAKLGGDAELPEGIGRLWGFRNRHLLPIVVPVYTMHFETFLKMRAAINGKRAAMGLKSEIHSKFQGTKLYQTEVEARKLLRFIREDEEFPQRVASAPLFPEGVEPTPEWETWMGKWWKRRMRPKLVMADILAKIRVHEDPP